MGRDAVVKYAAEAIGTFVLVFGGVGTAVFAGQQVGLAGVSFAFGLALLAMVYAIGPISGCHINPAVTFGALLCRKMAVRDVPGYVVGQIIGAIVAAGVILLIAKGLPAGYSASSQGLGANGYGAHSPDGFVLGACLAAEVVLTAFLVFTVLRATDADAPVGFAGLAIGLVLVLIHLVSIPITNTSVNPVRSLGPAVFVGGWALEQLWLFIVAPLAGAALAAGIYRALGIPAPVLTLPEGEQATPVEQRERMA
jgi:aquaporin Z